MNKWLIGLSFTALSLTVQADVSVIETRVKQADTFEVVIENTGRNAVARGYIGARFTTPGREVPWVDNWEQSYSVPGGIEPGETYSLELAAPPEIFDIQEHEVAAEVFFFSAFSVDREPLNEDAEFVVAELERHRIESEALQAEIDEMMESDQ